MSDWYDKAEDNYLNVVSDQTQVTSDDVRAVYNYFYNDGIIDYDVMKEFLWNDDDE